jgi:cell division protein FtsB
MLAKAGAKCDGFAAEDLAAHGEAPIAVFRGQDGAKLGPAGEAVRADHVVRRLTLFLERVLPVAILVVAVIGAPIMIFSPQGLPRLRGLEKELGDVEDENAELRRQIESLRGRVSRLRDDPSAVERIARDDLGLVRQTEVVFQFAGRR